MLRPSIYSAKRSGKPPLVQVQKGSKVRVLRPNMWAGFEGTVERHTAEFNVVRVPAGKGSLEIGAQAHELEIMP